MPPKSLLNLFSPLLLLAATLSLHAQQSDTTKKAAAKSAATLKPLFACGITGPSSVTTGNSYEYRISIGACTATTWKFSDDNCAFPLSSTSTSVTVFFPSSSCSSVTITAVGAAANPVTVLITQAPPPTLTGGTISTTSQTIDYGNTPGLISASTAGGGSCGTSYSYLWYSSTDGTNYTSTGTGGQNYQPGALTVTTYFKRLTSCNGSTVYTTNVATVTVNAQLQAGAIGNPSQTIDYGATPGQITAANSSGGGCGTGYSYLWYYSTDGTNFNSTGIGGQNYQPGPLTTTTYYKRVTTCNGATVSTTVATVTVNAQLNPGTITPASQAINSGATVTPLTLSGVTGSTAPYTYQWQSSADASFSSITNVGSGGTGFTPTGLTSTMYYRVLVTSTTGVHGYSSSAVVTVYPPLQVGNIIPATQTIAFDATPSSLNLTGLTGGNSIYAYQWQSSSDPSFTSPTNVSTNPTQYSPPNPGATEYYRLMVTSNGIPAYSNTAVINVISALSGGTISGNTGPINYSSLPGLISSTQDASGSTCSGNYTYQWQYSFDGTTWHDLINAAGNTYSSSVGLTISEYFRRQVSCSGTNAWSNSIHVTVNAQKQAACTP